MNSSLLLNSVTSCCHAWMWVVQPCHWPWGTRWVRAAASLVRWSVRVQMVHDPMNR